jgi:hypothetical protein
MRLYHGSNLIVPQIDLSLCRPYKDLTKGLEFKRLNDQYSFHTNEGIVFLEYVGADDDQ